MNLDEIVNLISVRQYVVNSMDNAALDRATVNTMNGMLFMIDKKIIQLLQGTEFKEYINYSNVRQTIEDVAKVTNIKSSLKK